MLIRRKLHRRRGDLRCAAGHQQRENNSGKEFLHVQNLRKCLEADCSVVIG